MKIFTIFKCLIRFLNLLFTILKFFCWYDVCNVATISSWPKWSCPATRSLREDQALLLRRRLPLVPRAASPHGGNLVAAVNDIWVQPLDTCDVLELCVILIIRGSLAIRRGQYRCPVTVQKEQQGIIRCRSGVGEQGKPWGDGKPGGPDVPPWKGG